MAFVPPLPATTTSPARVRRDTTTPATSSMKGPWEVEGGLGGVYDLHVVEGERLRRGLLAAGGHLLVPPGLAAPDQCADTRLLVLPGHGGGGGRGKGLQQGG